LPKHKQKLDQAALAGTIASEKNRDWGKSEFGCVCPILEILNAELSEHQRFLFVSVAEVCQFPNLSNLSVTTTQTD
jgi:hypothetical protein